jgi:ferredoxin-NADP reductase/MOSC domain-containing protein YiiM/ferredoxin
LPPTLFREYVIGVCALEWHADGHGYHRLATTFDVVRGTVARLVSVNVGLPQDIEWNGRLVHTGIWKRPVAGRCRVGRLNLEGDGQGDLAGHGGEHRAVFVYQLDSYRYWQERLNRADFVYGQFGENFTVQGLEDAVACIGDRYQIGSALFEITQPRVTCYRVGIRMNEPRMPALLTGDGRPGFYFRVLREGDVSPGDDIVKVGEAQERLTVEEANALLYSPSHPRDRLERALRIDALSSGWRSSFEALLQPQATATGSGNAGLMPAAAAHPVASGFRSVTVAAVDQEGDDVISLTLRDREGHPLHIPLPGQYVVVRCRADASTPPFFRSYSLSGPPSNERYRISVKLEPNGAAGAYLRTFRVGDLLDISLPRGSFTLREEARPVVLLSAGIGVTPVLAMLYALAASASGRPVLWLHQSRDRQHHPFATEVRRLLDRLPNGRSYVCYSRPGPDDRIGKDFDEAGHLSQSVFERTGVSPDAAVYLCGPSRFMTDMKQALSTHGVAQARVFVELFSGSESMTPGVVDEKAKRLPHPPEHDAATGALVSFARSGIAAHWNVSAYGSLLELAEACDVPVRWSCRTGVCHSCESGLVSGDVAYDPEPLDTPAAGNLLICCSRPIRDVVIDL